MNQTQSGESVPAEPLSGGSKLRGRYVVEGTLSRGTYGIVYAARDEKSNERVVLKEYFPGALAQRTAGSPALLPKNKACGNLFYLGSELFQRQHALLTQARGSENVVTVYDSFFENGTSYAVMERLEGVTLDRYLALRRRALTAGECMYIAASLADALLIVHSLNTLHHDLCAQSIFLCTDGTVKLIAFGEAKAALRSRRAPDDADPAADLTVMAQTLKEATGANATPGLNALFYRMLDENAAQPFGSVFDYRHALACVEVEAECPEVSVEEAYLPVPAPKKAEARENRFVPAEEPALSEKGRSRLDHVLDRMEQAVTSDRERNEAISDKEREARLKKRVVYLYTGIVAAALVVALILRGLIR